MKVEVSGTRTEASYLNGEYEKKRARIIAAARVGEDYDQTAVVAFESGEQRNFKVYFLQPVQPTEADEEALVMEDHKLCGKVVVLREKPEIGGDVAVSTREAAAQIETVPLSSLVALYPES